MVFSACFLPPTPSFFPPKPSDQFLFCVFLLAFLSKNTRHVFFPLHFLSYTHFSPLLTPISFRGVFSRLLFFPKTHDMCFFAYFSSHTHTFLPTPTFLPATYQLASGVGFLACFSLPTPTPWVFPLANFSSRPVFPPRPSDKLPGWVF